MSELNAEQVVIGSCLLEPAVAVTICSECGVSTESFADPKCRAAFKAIEFMAKKGMIEKIDSITLADIITKNSDATGWSAEKFLRDCIDMTPTVEHCQYYVDLVREGEVSDKAQKSLEVAARRLSDRTEPASEVMSDVIKDIIGLTATHSRKETTRDVHERIKTKLLNSQASGYYGIPSRWMSVNHILGSYTIPENVIVAGRPSCGKTTFALNEALHFGMTGVPVSMASFEMTTDSVWSILAGDLAHINMFKMRGGRFTTEDMQKLDMAFAELQSMPIYIDDQRMSIGRLCSWMTHESAAHGSKVFIVDYLQLMMKSRDERRASLVDVIGEWESTIKSMGKKLGAMTMVLSQLNRGDQRYKDETPPPPTLEALRSSGEIEQTADAVLMLYKKPNMPESIFTVDADWPMEMDVAKHREGPTGMKPMWFVRRRQKYMSEHEYDSFKAEELAANEKEATCSESKTEKAS